MSSYMAGWTRHYRSYCPRYVALSGYIVGNMSGYMAGCMELCWRYRRRCVWLSRRMDRQIYGSTCVHIAGYNIATYGGSLAGIVTDIAGITGRLPALIAGRLAPCGARRPATPATSPLPATWLHISWGRPIWAHMEPYGALMDPYRPYYRLT
jgi:hypothetical protein